MKTIGRTLMIVAALAVAVTFYSGFSTGKASGWDGEGAAAGMFILLVLGIPVVIIGGAVFLGGAVIATATGRQKRPSDRITMPDGTTLVRIEAHDGSDGHRTLDDVEGAGGEPAFFRKLAAGFYLIGALVLAAFAVPFINTLAMGDVIEALIYFALAAIPAFLCILAGNLIRQID